MRPKGRNLIRGKTAGEEGKRGILMKKINPFGEAGFSRSGPDGETKENERAENLHLILCRSAHSIGIKRGNERANGIQIEDSHDKEFPGVNRLDERAACKGDEGICLV